MIFFPNMQSNILKDVSIHIYTFIDLLPNQNEIRLCIKSKSIFVKC